MSTIEERNVIGPDLNGTLMTPDEFDSADERDELYRYELINGVLIVTPPPSIGERGSNEFLSRLLWDYHDHHPQGGALDYTVAEHEIAVMANRRRPDRVIWAGLGRFPDFLQDLPAIAVEIVSAGRRSRSRYYDAKRQEYHEVGIVEYWIIDRFRRQMTVYRNQGGTVTEIVLCEGDVYTTPLLPGFELPVSRLFAEADRLERRHE